MFIALIGLSTDAQRTQLQAITLVTILTALLWQFSAVRVSDTQLFHNCTCLPCFSPLKALLLLLLLLLHSVW